MIRCYSSLAVMALLTLHFQGVAQVLTNNGASITITSGGSITVKGGFTNGATATVTNSGGLTVSGNAVNNGTISAPAASTLRFNGTSAQTISGTTQISAKDVEMANAAGVTLNTPLHIDGAISFTSGVITATSSSAPVIFSANATVANTPTDASHIDGFVQKLGTGIFTFPVGDAARYQPVGMALSANGSGMTARYYGNNAGSAPFGTAGASATPLVAYNKAEYWDLTPASTAAGTVTIYFDGYKNTGIGTTSDLRVAHKTGGQWQNEGGTPSGTTGSGSVTSSSISTFSPFALGSISTGSLLPITLISFSGTTEGSANRLDWNTAREDAGCSFIIERSGNGSAFFPIGTLAGNGGNSGYTFYDREPRSPASYYRLKMSDVAGPDAYSRTVLLRRADDGPATSASVYPQPAMDDLIISTTSKTLPGTTAAVLDVQGKVVTSFTLEALQRLDVRSWLAGIYILRLADGTAVRIVKQ